MAYKKPEFSLERSRQEIDLTDYFPVDLSETAKKKFGELLIERMIERTQDGKSFYSRNFRQYTKQYAERKGVSIGDVDMTDTGDMLLSIKPGSEGRDKLILEISDSLQAKKSYNHNTGDTLPKRTFFGVQDKEIREIAKQVLSEIPSENVTKIGVTKSLNRLSESINLDQIVENIRLEQGE